jgi:acyl carrier protein
MTREAIYRMFVEVLAEHFEIEGDQVRDEALLVADFDLDSLDFAALGAEIEEITGVALDETDIRGCKTLGDLTDRFAARISECGC